MDRLQQILARQEQIRDRLVEIREITHDPEIQRYRVTELATETDTLVDEWNTLEAEREGIVKRDGLLARARKQGLPGAGGAATDPTVISRTKAETYDDIKRANTLSVLSLDEQLHRTDGALEILRSRGAPDESLARLDGLVAAPAEGEPSPVAQIRRAAATELILSASDPSYEAAWYKLLRNPTAWTFDLTDEERCAVSRTNTARRQLMGKDYGETAWGDASGIISRSLSLTGSAGGFLVPLTLDPTIILQNAGSANPWRRVARMETTATNTWQGVNSTGVTAHWYAEAGVVTDDSPTFGSTVITPIKAAAWTFGSYEVLEDADYETQLPLLLADAKDRLESTAFAVGTGATQPFGAVTRATASAIGGGLVTAAGIFTVHGALGARYRQGRPTWVGNVAVLDAMRVLPVGVSPITQLMLVAGQMTPWGETAYESSDMDGVIATGGHKVLLYMDASQYIIVDRIGMSVIYEPMVKDQATGRPTGQGGWYAFWRTGADSSVAGTSVAIRNLTLT